MIDDALVLRIERLRDDAEQLKASLRSRVRDTKRQVTSKDLKAEAASIAERWLVEVVPNPEISVALGDSVLADLSIEFQRLLEYADQATTRQKYDKSLKAILRDFRTRVIIPLKQRRGFANHVVHTVTVAREPAVLEATATVFVGQSFAPKDAQVNDSIVGFLRAYGLTVLSGDKPKATTVSKKVRDRIDSASIFIGVFTRRDKIARRNEWTTSGWVIDEKAYALAKNKTLILLKEDLVTSIGGLQGDYEYIEFSRTDLASLLIRILELLRSREP